MKQKYQTFKLARDNGPEVEFLGQRLAHVTSHNSHRNPERWTELALYRMTDGTLVSQAVGRTTVEGETTRNHVMFCLNVSQAIAFFGTGRLALKLYCAAGFDAMGRVA